MLVNSSFITYSTSLIGANSTNDELYNATSVNPHGSDQGEMSIEKIFSIIVQCFGLIITGYLFGRLNIVTQEQSKGISAFTSRICNY